MFWGKFFFYCVMYFVGWWICCCLLKLFLVVVFVVNLKDVNGIEKIVYLFGKGLLD